MLEGDQLLLSNKTQNNSISPTESTYTRPSLSSNDSKKIQDDFPSELLNAMIGNIDFTMPSVLLFKPMYFHSRKEGISVINEISNEFSLCDKTFHLSVLLLDRIFMKVNLFEESKRIAVFCVILSAKFAETEPYKSKLIEAKYSSSLSSNYKSDEVYFLKLLDYNLNCTTSYDIISYMITQGIFEEKNCERKAIEYLKKLIQKNFILQLNQLQVAFSVVEIFKRKNGQGERLEEIIELFQLEVFRVNLEYGYKVFNEALYRNKSKNGKRYKIKGGKIGN